MSLLRLLCLGLILLVCCSASGSRPVKTTKPISTFSPAEAKLHRSIGQLEFKLRKSGKLTATAWAVSKDYLVTAAHVCSGMEELAVQERLPNKFTMNYINAKEQLKVLRNITVVKMDTAADTCLLLAANHPLPPLPLELSFKKHVRRLDRVYMIGAPIGIFPVLKECNIISKYGYDIKDSDWAEDRLVTTCESIGGFSGSPILSEDGKVIGLISAGLMLQPFLPSNAFLSIGPSSEDILDLIRDM